MKTADEPERDEETTDDELRAEAEDDRDDDGAATPVDEAGPGFMAVELELAADGGPEFGRPKNFNSAIYKPDGATTLTHRAGVENNCVSIE